MQCRLYLAFPFKIVGSTVSRYVSGYELHWNNRMNAIFEYNRHCNVDFMWCLYLWIHYQIWSAYVISTLYCIALQNDFVRGIQRVNFPNKGQWRGALMFLWFARLNVSLICTVWCFFDHKRLDKQSWSWWFETPSRPLWRYCNEAGMSVRLYIALGRSTDANIFENNLPGMIFIDKFSNLCNIFTPRKKSDPQRAAKNFRV